MIKEVLKVSKIAPFRTRYDVLSKMMEEVGELAQEVGIKEGYQRRQPGKDGVTGECVDVIITALDLIFVDNPEVERMDILEVLNKKLAKWASYCPPKIETAECCYSE